MSDYIKLTSPDGKAIYVRPDSVHAAWSEVKKSEQQEPFGLNGPTDVRVSTVVSTVTHKIDVSHNGPTLPVKESPEEVMQIIDDWAVAVGVYG